MTHLMVTVGLPPVRLGLGGVDVEASRSPKDDGSAV